MTKATYRNVLRITVSESESMSLHLIHKRESERAHWKKYGHTSSQKAILSNPPQIVLGTKEQALKT